jgi:hypothetical protein
MFDPAAGNTSALLITEQVLVFAVFVGSVAALPAFIEFVTEVRKRKERIDLSLEDEVVSTLRPRVAGMDDLLNSIADLIDRARNPAAYQDLKIGNEVLIIGPNQTGKKSLAQKIAQLAGMDRVVTVFNPRDSDALAKAKSLVRGYKWQKVMLLLPRIDLAYQQGDPEVLTELDALIETTSERQNVLVAATTVSFEANSDLDNIFGIKLVLPGAKVGKAHRVEIPKTPSECWPKWRPFTSPKPSAAVSFCRARRACILRAHSRKRDQPGGGGRHRGALRDHGALPQAQQAGDRTLSLRRRSWSWRWRAWSSAEQIIGVFSRSMVNVGAAVITCGGAKTSWFRRP